MSYCASLGYSHDDGVCQDQSRWMGNLNENRTLSTLSIPGTHDTMSLGAGGDSAQTQSMSLINQLKSGIRFLDIRLAARPNTVDSLYVHHGFLYLNSTLANVLEIVTGFLANNPTETVLMRVKQEYTNESDQTFLSLLEKFLTNSKYAGYVWPFSKNNPTLKELRGKILVLQNFGGTVKWMPYGSFYIQDDYNVNSNWDLYGKWEKVKNHLYNANYSYSRNTGQMFINYLSASGGSFPYFIASGKSSASTGAPNLSTGLTEPAFKGKYPDFPRINRSWIFATIAFEGTNNLSKSYIDGNRPSYVGIVVSDFPGQGLINAIINANYR